MPCHFSYIKISQEGKFSMACTMIVREIADDRILSFL